MKKYIITWKIPDGYMSLEFNDIQWKDQFIRAKNDDTGDYYIIPYFSIYHIRVEDIEDENGE